MRLRRLAVCRPRHYFDSGASPDASGSAADTRSRDTGGSPNMPIGSACRGSKIDPSSTTAAPTRIKPKVNISNQSPGYHVLSFSLFHAWTGLGASIVPSTVARPRDVGGMLEFVAESRYFSYQSEVPRSFAHAARRVQNLCETRIRRETGRIAKDREERGAQTYIRRSDQPVTRS